MPSWPGRSTRRSRRGRDGSTVELRIRGSQPALGPSARSRSPTHAGRRFHCDRNSHKGALRPLSPRRSSAREGLCTSFSPRSKRSAKAGRRGPEARGDARKPRRPFMLPAWLPRCPLSKKICCARCRSRSHEPSALASSEGAFWTLSAMSSSLREPIACDVCPRRKTRASPRRRRESWMASDGWAARSCSELGSVLRQMFPVLVRHAATILSAR